MQARLKYAIAFFIALGIRMIPFRPANVEPLLGTMMPFSKRVSPLAGGAFALASFVIYDYFTAGIGTYTWETGLVYTLIGIAAGYYFQYFKQSRASYAAYAVIATLAFDLITGPIMISLAGHNFWVVTVAQIPFTISHLIGNVLFAVLLSPIIQKFADADIFLSIKKAASILN